MRIDIPEGAEYTQMPTFGWGRVLCAEWLQERYFTVRVLGWRLFIARLWTDYSKWPGQPRGPDRRFFRWFLRRTHEHT
jgi:hypothetical protein